REPHTAAVAQLHDAFRHDEVALLEPRDNLDDAEAPTADLNLLLPRDALAVDAIHVCAVLNLEDGPLGHDERRALLGRHLDREQHAGPQGSVVVLDMGP